MENRPRPFVKVESSLMKARCGSYDCKSGTKFLSEFTWQAIAPSIHQSDPLTVKFPALRAENLVDVPIYGNPFKIRLRIPRSQRCTGAKVRSQFCPPSGRCCSEQRCHDGAPGKAGWFLNCPHFVIEINFSDF
jgi:hypothetical protein